MSFMTSNGGWYCQFLEKDLKTPLARKPNFANYLHKNPAKRGLVSDPADWRWSSYRRYGTGEQTVDDGGYEGSTNGAEFIGCAPRYGVMKRFCGDVFGRETSGAAFRSRNRPAEKPLCRRLRRRRRSAIRPAIGGLRNGQSREFQRF